MRAAAIGDEVERQGQQVRDLVGVDDERRELVGRRLGQVLEARAVGAQVHRRDVGDREPGRCR